MERHGIARMRLVETQRVVVCAPFSFSFFFFVFFFLLFFLSFLFFFPLFFSFPLPSPPSLSSFLSFLSQTRTDLPAVLRRSLRFFAASQKTSRFAFWPLPPLASPIPLPTASPRFRSVSPLDFSASPSLLPLLNNCPPRGKDETRLLPGPSSTTGGIERCISTMYPSSLPSSTKKALDRALRNTFSFVSLDQWLGKRFAIPILLRSINLIVKRL